MKPFTGRTGTRIKAALCVIRAEGLNVASVEQHAEVLMRQGTPQTTAYDRAISEGLRNAPAVRNVVDRIDRLLSKSNDATIARYDHAINAHVGGDDGPIDALAPMMRNDMQAMAVRDGEVSVEDAAAGRVDWAAMGMPGMADWGVDSAPAGAPQTPVQSNEPAQRFAFGATPATASTPAPRANTAAPGRASFAEDRRQAAHDATTRPGQAPRTGPIAGDTMRDQWSNQAGFSTRGQYAEDRRHETDAA